MAQRGRKSLANQSTPIAVIDTQALQLKPPPYLTDAGCAVFNEVVGASDPRHFRKNELPLLCQFCEAIALARHYASRIVGEDDYDFSHRRWLEASRLATTLGTRLRLTPHSRIDARGAGRLRSPVKPPWEFSGDE